MSGFDNGGLQSGIVAQTKQFGSILRGLGPPVPQGGVLGDLYIDTQTWFLYNKRSSTAGDDVDPWGHYLFQVPTAYRATLKWFNSYAPGNDIGIAGDYCLLWSGFANYGMQPLIYGPKAASGWTENGEGPATQVDPTYAGNSFPVGLVDESTTGVAYSSSTQLIVAGLLTEYVLAIPITNNGGDPVYELGVQSGAPAVAVTLNSLYTALDEHSI